MKTCPTCGATLDDATMFCTQCGTNLQGAPDFANTQGSASNQDTVNQDAAPNQGMPNQGMPNQGMPNQGMPNQGMPNQGPMPGQGAHHISSMLRHLYLIHTTIQQSIHQRIFQITKSLQF